MTSGTARRLACAGLAGILLLFTVLAAVDLARVRPIGGDEVIILSITERWLADGRMGSPIYEGFHGAGDHSFFALVGHNVVQAPFVALLGADLVAARLPSLVAALALLVIVAVLAWRWFGPAAAVLATALLAFWRTGLVDMDYGFALLSLARQGRYDLTATLWMACTVLCLDMVRRSERHAAGWSIAAGLAAGLATVTQFYGVAILLVIATFAARLPDRRGRLRLLVGVLLGWTCVVAPYGAWVARHASDARAQFTHVHAQRIGDAAAADGANRGILREPLRLRGAFRLRGAGGVLFLSGSAAALAWLVALLRRRRGHGPDLLLTGVAAPLLLLALLDSTKAPVYAFPIFPPLCIAVAAACVAAFTQPHGGPRFVRPAVALALALVAVEAAAGLVHDQRVARRMTGYDELAGELSGALPSGAVPIGPVRWWWGLRDHGYVAFHALQLRWERASADTPGGIAFGVFLDRSGVTHVLMGDEMRSDLGRTAPAVGAEIRRRMAACGPPLATWTDPTYGPLAWQRIGACPR